MILVAGLPSSGNRLLVEHIRRSVSAAGTEESVQVWHADNSAPNISRPAGERLAVVIPVRSEPVRKHSLRRRSARGEGPVPLDVTTMRRNLMRFLVEYDLPYYLVSLEGLYEAPYLVGRDLLRWLDLPPVAWPTDRDPEKPEAGSVFNANYCHLMSGDTYQEGRGYVS